MDARVRTARTIARLAVTIPLRIPRLVFQLDAEPYKEHENDLVLQGRSGHTTLGYDDRRGGTRAREYAGFEDIFRPAMKVRELLTPYPGMLADHQPILDVGCGRGEFLDLAREAGLEARGVEVDAEMATRARRRGHDVTHADAVAHLASLPENALGAVFSAQVIEHLTIAELKQMIRESLRVLRQGGCFVAETVNPHSLGAAKLFWLDITHKQPIFPESLLWLCRDAGFRRAEIFFPHGYPSLRRNRRLCDSYAVIAEKL